MKEKRMKVLHLPSTYFPDYVGGKEVFLRELIRYTPAIEHRVLLHHKEKNDYVHEGTRVQVLPAPRSSNYRRSYLSLTYDDIGGFDKTVDEFQPDIVHFHDQSASASLSHLGVCHSRKIKTLVTYHSPGQSCLQRALTFANATPCDGRIIRKRCASCQYQLKGVPAWISDRLSGIQTPFDKTGIVNQRNKTDLFYSAWEEFYRKIDHVQVSAHWLVDLLTVNGVAEDKIHYVDLGGRETYRPTSIRSKESPLKVVFIGRCTDIKGVHILVDAILRLPLSVLVEVYFYGSGWDDTGYGRDLQSRMANDPRFKKPELLAPEFVVSSISQMDVCVIPSLWPETGPFTVFDAFAAGVPIIGTDLAGIRERVTDGVDGYLFSWGDSGNLADRIRYLAEHREVLQRLRSGITRRRTFAEFAQEMGNLYDRILNVVPS